MITSDATTNTPTPFYYPFSTNDHDNFGIAATGEANGKYAVLVLTAAGLTNLNNYIVQGDIKIQKRNGGTSEQGIGVRFNASNPSQLLQGHRVHEALPSGYPRNAPSGRPQAGAETGRRNYHFENYATCLDALFFPKGMRIAAHAVWFVGFPDWSAGFNNQVLHESNKYFESCLYDGQACQGILEFVYTVYQKNISSLMADADNFLIKLQNNRVAKWYSMMNVDPSNDFIIGGRSNLNFDGDKNAAATLADLSRTNICYSCLYKIARDFNAHWTSVTAANQSPSLPAPSQLFQFYHDQAYNTARYLVSRLWSYPGSSYAQFWAFAHSWGEFSDFGNDLNHAGALIYFLMESYHHGFVTYAEIDKLRQTFTDCVWNNDTSSASVELSFNIHPFTNPNGHVNASEYVNNTGQNCDFFLLMSELDFRIWEILDTWFNKTLPYPYAGSVWQYYHYYLKCLSIHPALLLYTVKYGIPKNLHVSSFANGGTTVNLSWSQPSSWSSATRLKYYNIYTRRSVDSWSSAAYASVLTSQTSFQDNNLDLNTGYVYRIRSQDRTSAITNQSDPSYRIGVRGGQILPPPPEDVTITGSVGQHPTICWSANNEPDLAGYKVYRKVTPDESQFSLVATTSQTSWTDAYVTIRTGGTGGQYAYYYVKAYNTSGSLSDASPTVYKPITNYNPPQANDGNGSVPKIPSGPTEFALEQNHPNPFNPSTQIALAVPEPAQVKIVVLDLLGREIIILTDQFLTPSYQTLQWHGTDASGKSVGSGVYFCRMTAQGTSGKQFVKTVKMTLIK